MNRSERENFYKNAILIVDNTRKAFTSLINLELTRANITFEEFINQHQHEIYHLCFNKRKCCRCSPDYSLPSIRLFHRRELEVLFEKNEKFESHDTDIDSPYCCSRAKANITTERLDVVLAKHILSMFCRDVFWYSCLEFSNKTLEEFLDEQKHVIYHLWKFDIICCKCSSGFYFPSDKAFLNQNHWDRLFSSTGQPCLQHTNRRKFGNRICAVKATLGIKLSDLDADLQDVLIKKCSRLRLTTEMLDKNLNAMYSRAKDGKISDKTFKRYQAENENCLLFIADICGTSEKSRAEIDEVYKRPLNDYLCSSYQGTLLEILGRQKSLSSSSFKSDSGLQLQHYPLGIEIEDSQMLSAEGYSAVVDDVIEDTEEGIQIETCEFCEIDKVSVICLECGMSLCDRCNTRIHRRITSNRNHVVVPREGLENAPKVKQICETHGNILSFFCISHDLPICTECLKIQHSMCSPISLIENIAKNVKTSTKMQELQSYSSNLLSNIQIICAKINDEIQAIPDKKKQFTADVEESKNNMDNILSSLEREGVKDISKYEGKIRAIYHQLLRCKATIERSEKDVSTLKSYASDYQTFLGLYEIENNLRRSENSMRKVFEDNNVSTIEPKLNFSFEKLKPLIFEMGYNEIEMPQMIYQPQSASLADIYTIQLTEITRINLKKEEKDIQIRGCAITQNGELWFADRDNNRVLFYNRNGTQISERHLPCTPLDLTSVGVDKMVVSLGECKSIATFDINTMSWTEQKFPESVGNFGGIASINEKLVVRIGGFGYYIINTAGDLIKKIEKPGQYMPYIACGSNTIYYAKWDVGKIFCCSMSGEDIWETFVGSTLKPPNGVTVDESGNIYATGSYSNNVVLISSDGKKYREIISDKEGLQNPIAIDYDKRSKHLLVSSASGIAVLYSVSRK